MAKTKPGQELIYGLKETISHERVLKIEIPESYAGKKSEEL